MVGLRSLWDSSGMVGLRSLWDSSGMVELRRATLTEYNKSCSIKGDRDSLVSSDS